MLVYSFQYFLINLYRITATQGGDPLLFQIVLVVGHHLGTHIRIVIGILLQLLTINGIDGIVGIGGIRLRVPA